MNSNTTVTASAVVASATPAKVDPAAEREKVLEAVLKKLTSSYKTVNNAVGVNKFQLCIFSGCVDVPYEADELQLLRKVVIKIRNASVTELQALKAALEGV